VSGWDPAEFELDDDLVHLNHAGVAPWPRRCADAVARFAKVNATRSYAGQFAGWMETEQRLRQRLAALINADGPDDIALVKNTSEGLSQVAHGLDWNPGDRVVALDEEFISNLIVWESLEVHGVDLQRVVPDGDASPESALEAACDARTRLMAVSSVQYGTGRRMDLERLGRFCRARDILFCVDAIQSLGALRFDAVASNADFVVSGAHKWLMSPFGVGLLWMRPALRDAVRPLAYGWHSVVDPMRFAGTLAEMEPSARRYEAGTANLAAIMGFEATLSLF
jgi:cysteine desulfurase / selenocysteine lyase